MTLSGLWRRSLERGLAPTAFWRACTPPPNRWQENSSKSALQDYRGVANDASAPAGLRDFAQIQLAALSVDKETYKSLARSLGALRSGTSEWRFTAKEILGLAAYKEGKKAEAEQLYREIMSDGEAPAGMRQRAQVMLALLLEQSKAAQADSTGTKDGANEAKTQ